MSFASRTATRERLNLFTTNYDRLIEYACDLTGIRVVDRFVGSLTPVFRSSSVNVDLHYSPPGIRGEPRYLEGVVRLTKLHGSIDWRWSTQTLRRYAVPFGAASNHPDVVTDPLDSTIIYPNPAKDVETIDFPFAELFRDYSAATCRPNSALVTYGYGFGDDHINRVIKVLTAVENCGAGTERECRACGGGGRRALSMATKSKYYPAQTSIRGQFQVMVVTGGVRVATKKAKLAEWPSAWPLSFDAVVRPTAGIVCLSA